MMNSKYFIIAGGMVILTVFLLIQAIDSQTNTNQCVQICEDSTSHSVGYQLIGGLHGEDLCVCYHPNLKGNEIRVHYLD